MAAGAGGVSLSLPRIAYALGYVGADTRDAGVSVRVVIAIVREGVMGVARGPDRSGGGKGPRPRKVLRVERPPEPSDAAFRLVE